MKKSISLFGKNRGKRSRRDYDDRDLDYGRDDYPEDEYDDEDYPDEEFEEQYGDELEDEFEDEETEGGYAEGDYPEDDYTEDDYVDDDGYVDGKREYDRREDAGYAAAGVRGGFDFDVKPGQENFDFDADRNYGRNAGRDGSSDATGENYRGDDGYYSREEYPEDDRDYREEDDGYYRDDNEYAADDRDYREEDDGYYRDDRNYRGNDEEYYRGNDDEYYEDDYYPEEDYDDYAAAGVAGGFGGGRGAGRNRNAADDRRSSRADRGGRENSRKHSDKNHSSRDAHNNHNRHSKHDRRDRDDRANPILLIGGKLVNFVRDSSAVEKIAILVAIVLLAGGIATAAVYSQALGKRNDITSFAEVGTSLEGIDMVGKSGLLAVADAQRAKAMAADMLEEDEPTEEEIIEENKSTTITMTLTSIKSDMKVKFINSETNRLVSNVHFEISVVTPDGTTVTYDDHDMDGIIYKNNVTAGTYKITPKPLASEYSDYTLDTTTKSLTVKDTVEMKAVDVSNEIKKESQVNAAKEDTAVQDVVESALTDTVEYVESTKTPVGTDDSNGEYEKVDKSTIPDPSSSSKINGGFGSPDYTVLTASAINGQNASFMSLSTSRGKTDENPDVAGETRSEDGENTGEGGGSETPEDQTMYLSPNSITLDAGESTGISGAPDGATFKSSNESVATVSSDGTVKGVGEGTATITVSASGYKDGTVSVTINKVEEPEPEDKEMSLSPTSISLKVGDTQQISGAPSGATYKTSNDGSVSVDSSGMVTAKAEGSATITVSATGYKDGTVSVSVGKADPKTISVNPSSITLKAGESTKITVSGPSSVTFKSSSDKVATVSSDGTVKAVAEGTADITVSAKDYENATVKVTVEKAAPNTITVSPDALNLTVGDTSTLTAKGPSSVTFKSGNDKVATVDKNGKVTAVGEGETDITVSAKDYADATVKVTVKKKSGAAAPVKVTKVVMVQGQTFKLESKDSKVTLTCKSGNDKIATVKDTTITGVGAGSTTITVSAKDYSDATVNVTVVDKNTVLKDKNGNELYVKDGDKYRKATYEDYYKKDMVFYLKKAATTYKYTGWQTIDGKTYYFDKNGNYVTGEQVIQGAKYTFGSDGVLSSSSGTMGIDVSKWNGNINWSQVKNSGVNFVIIRCGYRGSSAGALIEDPKFRENIKGAQAAGLRVGVYFFTQAVNEVEAVEEASMVISQIKGYGISMPVYLDVEASNGRGDTISASQRTANIRAFCGTIKNAGYKTGVYGNKTWLTSYINTSQLTSYKIWLAQYAAAPSYTATRYDMWQYTSKGSVPGISGNVDMNILYN